mmetsp:Transcript_28401/g.62432  ORF Transcript_28401/g.62432 Transcript_28401/m.62432 type:complete len:277 (+) Transcript_28401:1351-2181(+)
MVSRLRRTPSYTSASRPGPPAPLGPLPDARPTTPSAVRREPGGLRAGELHCEGTGATLPWADGCCCFCCRCADVSVLAPTEAVRVASSSSSWLLVLGTPPPTLLARLGVSACSFQVALAAPLPAAAGAGLADRAAALAASSSAFLALSASRSSILSTCSWALDTGPDSPASRTAPSADLPSLRALLAAPRAAARRTRPWISCCRVCCSACRDAWLPGAATETAAAAGVTLLPGAAAGALLLLLAGPVLLGVAARGNPAAAMRAASVVVVVRTGGEV